MSSASRATQRQDEGVALALPSPPWRLVRCFPFLSHRQESSPEKQTSYQCQCSFLESISNNLLIPLSNAGQPAEAATVPVEAIAVDLRSVTLRAGRRPARRRPTNRPPTFTASPAVLAADLCAVARRRHPPPR
uniref:Uncharacterized protein n=1 Tax=Oryza meridionalis TaxID=40149 RepID=A0A0E0F700_9ORYZ